MIVRREGTGWAVVNQHDHAAHAGKIAAAWHTGPFGPLPLAEHLVRATTLHDNGWTDPDSSPSLDPATGGPLNFVHIRDTHHATFYRRGIERVAQDDPLAGYLDSLHASGIYGGRYGWHGLEQIAWPEISASGVEFLKQQQTYRAGLLTATTNNQVDGFEFEAVWRAYMLLQTFDFLSLQCCLGAFAAGCSPVPLGDQLGDLCTESAGPWSLHLTPFPFSGSTLTLTLQVRVLPETRFADVQALRQALSEAPYREQATTFTAGPIS